MDKDLAFLVRCSNEELELLFKILIEEGSLTESIRGSEEYKKYGADYRQYVDLLAQEVLDFGSNTFWFREDYHTVAQDACKKLGVSYNSLDSAEEIEDKMCAYLMGETWKSLSEDTQMAFLETWGYNGKNNHTILKAVGSNLFFNLLRDSTLASYQMSLIVANAVARQTLNQGLSFAAAAFAKPLVTSAFKSSAASLTLGRAAAVLAGPIGWALTAGWTIVDIAGPAYRVTIPAVSYIGCLRNIKKYQRKG